jgi:hypothetical protein
MIENLIELQIEETLFIIQLLEFLFVEQMNKIELTKKKLMAIFFFITRCRSIINVPLCMTYFSCSISCGRQQQQQQQEQQQKALVQQLQQRHG